MTITLELWKEYTSWCRDNKNKGYSPVYAPDFNDFMAYIEATYPQGDAE